MKIYLLVYYNWDGIETIYPKAYKTLEDATKMQTSLCKEEDNNWDIEEVTLV